MIKKKIGIIFLILFFIVLLILLYSKIFTENKIVSIKTEDLESKVYSSNLIKNVKYTTKDNDGNEYTITAAEGEIDYSNPAIIYLTDVKALIKLVNSENILIISDYGKYNTENFDTIFSKNVKMNYLNHKIIGEYLDFSLERNLMLISKKVVYTNLENVLRADAIEIDIQTKESKIFMYESQKKVNIKSKN